MSITLPKETDLLIIDVQNVIDNPEWCKYGKRNNSSAEDNMSASLK